MIDYYKHNRAPYIVIIGIFLIAVLYINRVHDAYVVTNGSPEFSAKLHLEDSIIRTDKNILWIGETIDYVFLRVGDSSNMILNKRDILMIEKWKSKE